jgi:hypothetical protein
MSEGRQSDIRTDDFHRTIAQRAGLRNPKTSWYEHWYLRLRLEEETVRAIRYRRPLALIGLSLGASSIDGRQLARALHEVAANDLRLIDLPGILDDGIYVIALPETAREGASIVAARLATILKPFVSCMTIVSCPEDGTTSGALIQSVRNHLAGQDRRAG